MLLILLTGILFICAGVLFSQRIEVTFHHIYSEKMKNGRGSLSKREAIDE